MRHLPFQLPFSDDWSDPQNLQLQVALPPRSYSNMHACTHGLINIHSRFNLYFCGWVVLYGRTLTWTGVTQKFFRPRPRPHLQIHCIHILGHLKEELLRPTSKTHLLMGRRPHIAIIAAFTAVAVTVAIIANRIPRKDKHANLL